MDQNSNYITVEFTFKLRMMDYRYVLGLKKTWIIAIAVGVIQLISWYIKGHGP